MAVFLCNGGNPDTVPLLTSAVRVTAMQSCQRKQLYIATRDNTLFVESKTLLHSCLADSDQCYTTTFTLTGAMSYLGDCDQYWVNEHLLLYYNIHSNMSALRHPNLKNYDPSKHSRLSNPTEARPPELPSPLTKSVSCCHSLGTHQIWLYKQPQGNIYSTCCLWFPTLFCCLVPQHLTLRWGQ